MFFFLIASLKVGMIQILVTEQKRPRLHQTRCTRFRYICKHYSSDAWAWHEWGQSEEDKLFRMPLNPEKTGWTRLHDTQLISSPTQMACKAWIIRHEFGHIVWDPFLIYKLLRVQLSARCRSSLWVSKLYNANDPAPLPRFTNLWSGNVLLKLFMSCCFK